MEAHTDPTTKFQITNTKVDNPDEFKKGETHILLESNDNQYFAVSKMACIKNSELLKSLLDDIDGDEVHRIPMPNVNGQTLQYVIEYMEHYAEAEPKELPKPLNAPIKEIIDKWDQNYVFTILIENDDEKQHEKLIDTVMAANFMNIEPLRELCCAVIAHMIKGKTPEEIRDIFNIENDFSPEEEKKIREENRWVEDSDEGDVVDAE